MEMSVQRPSPFLIPGLGKRTLRKCKEEREVRSGNLFSGSQRSQMSCFGERS